MDQSTQYMLISLIKMVTIYQLLLFTINLIMPKEKKSGLNSNNLKPLLIQISYVLEILTKSYRMRTNSPLIMETL